MGSLDSSFPPGTGLWRGARRSLAGASPWNLACEAGYDGEAPMCVPGGAGEREVKVWQTC